MTFIVDQTNTSGASASSAYSVPTISLFMKMNRIICSSFLIPCSLIKLVTRYKVDNTIEIMISAFNDTNHKTVLELKHDEKSTYFSPGINPEGILNRSICYPRPIKTQDVVYCPSIHHQPIGNPPFRDLQADSLEQYSGYWEAFEEIFSNSLWEGGYL